MRERLFVNAAKVLATTIFMCSAAQASATQFFFCYVEPAYGSEQDILALSRIVEVDVDRLDNEKLVSQWLDHLDDFPTDGTRSFRDSERGGCLTSGNRASLEADYEAHYRSTYQWGEPLAWAPAIEKVVPRDRPREGVSIGFGSAPPSSAPAQDDAASRTPGIEENKLSAGQALPSNSNEADQEARFAAQERDRREAEETARLNREAAEFAASQVAENEAARRKAEAERKAYEAELARVEQEKSRHELAMEQHRREREEANRRQQEYFAAQRRHALCIGGDRKACADIEAGKPALADASTNEEASTEQDATRCVSAPVVSADPTFRGSTQAVVVNGCDAPVDVRVCLMRTGGWNCGTTWNLAPQGRWAHTSFESDGQVFWDARVSTASRALARP